MEYFRACRREVTHQWPLTAPRALVDEGLVLCYDSQHGKSSEGFGWVERPRQGRVS
jgi:hypothetical protein